jgi:hypothetical protein
MPHKTEELEKINIVFRLLFGFWRANLKSLPILLVERGNQHLWLLLARVVCLAPHKGPTNLGPRVPRGCTPEVNKQQLVWLYA